MSESRNRGRTVPSKEISINLDVHGFELNEDTPGRVKGQVVEDIGNHLLEFDADGDSWRFEMQVDGRGSLKPVDAYYDGTLVASDHESYIQDVYELPRWVRFVLETVSSEVSSS